MDSVIWSLTAEGFKHVGLGMYTPASDPKYEVLAAAVYSEQHGKIPGILVGDILEVTHKGHTVKYVPQPVVRAQPVAQPVVRAQPVAQPVVRAQPVAQPIPESVSDNPLWDRLDAMDRQGLMEVSLKETRPYARFRWGIIGASKIPGGKPVLVDRILAARAQA